MESKIIIKLSGLTKRFANASNKPVDVLNGVNVSFEQGLTYAITGVSGSGKSTLLFILAGFDQPTSGSIILEDTYPKAHLSLSTPIVYREKLGVVFQKPFLLKELTVLENIILKKYSTHRSAKIQEAFDLLHQVGLLEKAHEYPATLSGGQQQRVAIARALFGSPHFIIADEPTAHLDQENKQSIVDLLLKLSHQKKLGLILSTHDNDVAKSMAHQYKISDGKLINMLSSSSS